MAHSTTPDSVSATIDDVVRNIAAGVASLTGDAFFVGLARFIAETLQSKYVLVGRVDSRHAPTRVDAFVVYTDGEPQARFSYNLMETPCAAAVAFGPRVVARDFRKHFPRDQRLGHMAIESYVGAPLIDSQGAPLGILVALNDRPLEESERARSILQIFAARAAAELDRLDTEAELRRGEERYALAQKAANIGVWEWNIVTNDVYWSEAIEPMFGFTPGEFDRTFESYLMVFHPDDRSIVTDAVAATLERDAPYRFEHRIVLRDGTVRWLACEGTLFRDAANRPLRMLGVVRDITERKRQEKNLRESEARWRLLVSSIPDFVVHIDENARILAVNHLLPGYTLEHVLSRPLYDFIPPESHAIAQASIANAFSTGEITAYNARAAGVPDEFRDYETRVCPIREDGVPKSALVIATDVTERRHVDDVLATLARGGGATPLEEFMLDCARQLAGVYGARYVFAGRLIEPECTHMSTLAYLVGGRPGPYEVYDLRGTVSRDVINGKVGLVARDVPRLYPDDMRLRQAGVESFIGMPLVASDGRVLGVVLVLDTKPMKLESWTQPVLGVFATRLANEIERAEALRELQQSRVHLEERVRERTAELEALNHELEAFSYSVSHDLRAPLRGIDGFSRALEEDYADKMDDNARAYLGRVRGAAHHMEDLIDALLRLSRISLLPLKRERVDLGVLAVEALAMLRESSPARRVEITIAPNLEVYADKALARVAIDNLLSNAFKYTAENETARIALSSSENHGQRVFCVADNGVGFDMQFAGKLFGAFQRLHSITQFEGLGIGLATVRRIMRRHGGDVWADAAPGNGARFYFTLGTEARGDADEVGS